MLERALFLEQATGTAARVYEALAHAEQEGESMSLQHTQEAAQGTAGEDSADLRLIYRPSYDGPLEAGSAEVSAGLRARLSALRPREIAQGANVLGPHRDDLAFFAGGMDISTYGSRGQQRSVALALKLAELDYIEQETGDQPILLLDDVLSELDEERRRDLLGAVHALDQVLLTTTDIASLPSEVRSLAHVYQIREGTAVASA
jgi:DNA replication and repair protein RecF